MGNMVVASIRQDEHGVITHGMLGEARGTELGWETKPRFVEVDEIVDLIDRGTPVYAAFMTELGLRVGPRFRIRVIEPGGHESIELDVPGETDELGRGLKDIPSC